jgi:ribosomal protein S1
MTDDFDPQNVIVDNLIWLFPGFRSVERQADWESLKLRVSLGSRVSGAVVARYPFGVFVDIGAGFPALLLIVRFKEVKHRGDSLIESFPSLGSTIEARILGWADGARGIVLTQLENEQSWGPT